MRKVIFHYHLFKNAGTSVDAILKASFTNRWVTQEFNGPQAATLKQVADWIQQQNNALAFSSHTAALPPPTLPDVEIFPIIFVRHPIDRIASAYYFERKQNSDNDSAVLAKNTDLAGYIDTHLAHGRISQCRNFQSHRLSQYMLDNKGDLTALALQTLETLPFVGLVEAFDESIHQLSQWLLPHFPEFRPLAVAKNVGRIAETLEQKLAKIRTDIGEQRYQDLLAANSADMAVFEAVQARYAHQQINHTIMQFWDTPKLPDDIAPLIETWKQKNPSFPHRQFNDETARTYIAEHFPPNYLAAFDACAIPAMRSDFFRYAYIYNEGGIYVDVSFSCATPLVEWLDFNNKVVFLLKKHVHIITNSFIAAQKGNEFIKAMLEQTVTNIHNRTSANLWLVTGPGVIKQVLANTPPEDSPTLLDFRLFASHCPPGKDLAHKKESHWSAVQKEHSIFTQGQQKITSSNIISTEATDTPSKLPVKLLLIGHPSCGSKPLSQQLASAGLRIGHEKLGDDGICSWWLTSQRRPALNGFSHNTKTAKNILVPELLCHFIRDPLAAIPDILAENETNQRDTASFKHRRDVIKRKFQVDIANQEPLTAAVLSYVYWNRFAEEANPDVTIRVEKMATDLLPIYTYFGISLTDNNVPLPPANQDHSLQNKTTAAMLLPLVTGKARVYLEGYLALYGHE